MTRGRDFLVACLIFGPKGKSKIQIDGRKVISPTGCIEKLKLAARQSENKSELLVWASWNLKVACGGVVVAGFVPYGRERIRSRNSFISIINRLHWSSIRWLFVLLNVHDVCVYHFHLYHFHLFVCVIDRIWSTPFSSSSGAGDHLVRTHSLVLAIFLLSFFHSPCFLSFPDDFLHSALVAHISAERERNESSDAMDCEVISLPRVSRENFCLVAIVFFCENVGFNFAFRCQRC